LGILGTEDSDCGLSTSKTGGLGGVRRGIKRRGEGAKLKSKSQPNICGIKVSNNGCW